MPPATGTFGLCARCAKALTSGARSANVVRAFTTTVRREDLEQRIETRPATDPTHARLRRREAAIASTTDIPFTQLPYQCFQEALTFLREDRAEKVAQIEEQRRRIARLEENVQQASNENKHKIIRSLNSSRQHLEHLKVQADINDPLVKKRFEDGLGDMGKPVYRHLARRKWESYEKRIVLQRITQMSVVPDVLPTGGVEPSVQLRLEFGGKRVPHGVVSACQV